MRPTARDQPDEMGLFELWMGMTPEDWDALPPEQDADADSKE